MLVWKERICARVQGERAKRVVHARVTTCRFEGVAAIAAGVVQLCPAASDSVMAEDDVDEDDDSAAG